VEKKSSGLKLTVELVPKSSWYSNVRSHVDRSTWDLLRKHSYAAAKNRCQICREPGALECHEEWEYDDDRQIQKLKKLVSLCPVCHGVKHLGFSYRMGKLAACLEQLMRVNNMTYEEATGYVSECFRIWIDRSRIDWTVDISHVEKLIKKINAKNAPGGR
jgi:hypothetical protein